MQHQPFKARDVRYDAQGNIILLPRESQGVIILHVPPPALQAGTEKCFWKFPRILTAAQERLHACERSAPPTVRLLVRSGRFAAHFMAVFLLLFLSLNFQSYFAVARAYLLPESDAGERRALEAVAGPRAGEHLLSVPSLPVAGSGPLRLLASVLRVAPPDNRLIIPKLAKNVPLVSVTNAALRRGDFRTLEKDIQVALRHGVVHYPGTARPGEIGNIFLTGHSAYLPWDSGRYKEVFARLSSLESGDEYAIYYEGKLHRYRIAKKFEVSPRNVTVLDQPSNRRMSTLMTCTPRGTTLLRLILQADEIDPVTGEVMEVAEGTEGTKGTKGTEGVQWGEELPI